MSGTRCRTRVDCPHGGKHRHGTTVAYRSDRCGCEPCRNADRHATNLRKLRSIEGSGPFISAAPTVRRIRQLQAAGMGTKTIAAAAGLNVTTLDWLIRPRPGRNTPRTRIRPATAAKILAVRPRVAAERAVDATGARRRLQALIANGWCMTELGRQLGYTGRSAKVRVNQWMRCGMRRSTVDRIEALYEQLWDQPPPAETPRQHAAATIARDIARRNGWLPPLAWDDETIDNPDTEPFAASGQTVIDDIAVELAMRGEKVALTKAERTEAVEKLAAKGLGRGEIGRLLRMSGSEVHRRMNRKAA